MGSKLHTDENKLYFFLTFPNQIIKFHFITLILMFEVISHNLIIKRKKSSETKVLFIYRCSKNWQKKSVFNHLLTNFYCSYKWKVLYLPDFICISLISKKSILWNCAEFLTTRVSFFCQWSRLQINFNFQGQLDPKLQSSSNRNKKNFSFLTKMINENVLFFSNWKLKF